MKLRLLLSEVFPFYLHLVALAAATIALDLLLHLTNLVWIGRYLGIPGVLLILASFGHSLRKRGLIESSNPARLLRLHEWLAWFGATLVLVHAGVHFNAVLGWLAIAAMAVNIVSGLTGKYLVLRAQRWLKAAWGSLGEQGLGPEKIEQQLFWDSLAARLVRKWRVIHIPISAAFAGLATAHIVAVVLFWGWK